MTAPTGSATHTASTASIRATPAARTRSIGPAGTEALSTSGRAMSSAGREATVRHDLGAGDEGRLVAGQEQGDVGDLPGLGDAAERDARLELLADGVGEIRRLQRSVHDAGMNDVAADLVLRELDGQRLRQRDERALGGGVGV